MKNLFFFLFAGALLISEVQAQPDLANAPKAENPPNRARGQRAQGTNGQNWQQMFITRELERVGIQDPAVQKAVTLYVEGETKAQSELSQKARSLQQALRGDALTDTQVAALLHDYNAAVEENKERRETAVVQLNKSVDLSKNPRLEAQLTVLGFLGDGPMMMNGAFNFNARGGENRGARGNRANNQRNNQPRQNANTGVTF